MYTRCRWDMHNWQRDVHKTVIKQCWVYVKRQLKNKTIDLLLFFEQFYFWDLFERESGGVVCNTPTSQDKYTTFLFKIPTHIKRHWSSWSDTLFLLFALLVFLKLIRRIRLLRLTFSLRVLQTLPDEAGRVVLDILAEPLHRVHPGQQLLKRNI